MPGPHAANGQRSNVAKSKGKGALSNSSSAGGLLSVDGDFKRVFGLETEPSPGGTNKDVASRHTNSRLGGRGVGRLATSSSATGMQGSPIENQRLLGLGDDSWKAAASPVSLKLGPRVSQKHNGVKLESLGTPKAFDGLDLSHLKSAVRRRSGYMEDQPPLAMLLEERGVDYVHPNPDRDVQLPLEPFEDMTMCMRTAEEWHQLMFNPATGELTPLACRALKTLDDGSGRWQVAAARSWDAKTQRYLVRWANGAEDQVISLHVLFDGDDPYLFADRLAKALRQRRYAKGLLEYHFFIDNMPEDPARKVGKEAVARIASIARASLWDANNEFADKLQAKMESLFLEVHREYGRSQNQIAFDKVRGQGCLNVLPSDFLMPPPAPPQEVPWRMPKELPSWSPSMGPPDPEIPCSLREAHERFCHASLLIRPEIVTALLLTQSMCIDLSKESVFDMSFESAMGLPDFSEKENGSITRFKGRLGMWMNTVRMHITVCLQKAAVKWFNLNETSLSTYKASRLRSFLCCARFMMSQAFMLLAEDNLLAFTEAIESFVPSRVDTPEGEGALTRIQNYFRDETSEGGERIVDHFTMRSLFQLEVNFAKRQVAAAASAEHLATEPRKKKGKDDNPNKKEQNESAKREEAPPPALFEFSIMPDEFQKAIIESFERGILAFHDVHSVESMLMPHLIGDDRMHPNFTREDAWVQALLQRLEVACSSHQPWLAKVIELVDEYRDVVRLDPEADAKRLEESDESPEQVRALIEERKARQRQVMAGLPGAQESVKVGFYIIDTNVVRAALNHKLEWAVQLLLSRLATQLDRDVLAASESFSNIFTTLRGEVTNIEELSEMRDFLGSVPGELAKLQTGVNDAIALTELIEDLHFVLPTETLDARWRMFGSSGNVKREVQKVEEYLDTQHKEYSAKQDIDQDEFDKRLNALEQVIEGFGQYQDIAQVHEVAEQVRQTNVEIQKCQELARLYNSRDALFDRDQYDYAAIGTMIKSFEPYSNLWKTAGDWVNNKKAWLDGSFDNIDPRHCENEVTGGIRILFKTIRALRESEDSKAICAIAEQIKAELEEFKPNLPLIIGLRNEGMRERHWEQVSNKCKVEVGPDMAGGFTLQTLLDIGLLNYVQEVEAVGDRAGKEYTLEKALRKMKEDWEPLMFDLSEKYRKTGTYILKGDGEAMTLLDEHIVTTQAMMFSMFKGPFEEEIDDWNTRLMRVSETLEEWLKCQKAWMYLQPIFDSDDIMRQLPTEGKRFKHVDATWRAEMINARENPKIIDVCATEGLLEKWCECNTVLDLVQKGLEDYLETKRNGFSRFYFLSNDELLEILSQTKDPTRVQPFLSKVFEAMAKVTFAEDNSITEMISPEGEHILLEQPVVTHQKLVENWMGELEEAMRTSIRKCLEVGVGTYQGMDRPTWVISNAAQCTLNGSQVHWTAEVEEAIDNGTMLQYAKKLADQIQGLVMLFRRGLTKPQQTMVSALVVIDVHAKNIIFDFAEKFHVTDKTAFEWISQLRYYWEMDVRGSENMWVKCVQTSFPYGYEYLGNSMRLVITPLTDMCYITLMGALSLNLGGAPAGPAGTGKTETTKDLAKALAKQCVVFNCSPEMDYIMIGKFFKGLAFSGAWCCFDEFNRINIEVLSVIAQQLLVLFGKKAELPDLFATVELEFEGTLVVMKPTFNVYITMNPGYAGRAELPDNLAALFRPVAMMVPDYALIGQIMFYAYGFGDAESLAKKMVTTMTLSSEQLSSQCHYDYGMRAVKTTIEMCGKLKRELGAVLQEDQITLRALRDVNVPKFLADDLPLFENIISDLFPTTERPKMEYGNLMPVLTRMCAEMNILNTENFGIKVVQLIDTIGVRHGLMIVGPTGGGKTCNYRVLQKTSGKMLEEGDQVFQKVQTHILNPKAITQAQLYGAFDEVTREWSDGIASECVRTAVASGKGGCPDNHWVIFDGPVDALWIESMNTVLDDNKKLCLTSGEIIALTPQMRMVFEVEDLTVASPATVSRCGMVYMEPSALGNEPLVSAWINALPTCFPPAQKDTLRTLMLTYTLPLLKTVRKKTAELSKTVDNNLVQSHFRLLDCYFADYNPTEAWTPNADDVTKLGTFLHPLFFYTLVWSVGATCDNNGRKLFSETLWDMVHHEGTKVGGDPEHEIPDGAFWYSYVFEIQGERENMWTKWLDFAPKYEVPAKAEYQDIVVPTEDSIRLTHVLRTLILKDKHVIVAGNTGTGKSVYITLWLQKDAPETIMPLFISFSAQTHVNQVQDLLDSKFEKRRRGVYGPPAGKRYIIFVDDMNMPKKEYYGAQPPIELLRQWHDYRGWYNRKELKMQEIIDIVHVAAMGPPGGGRTELTGRVKRHYNTLVAADMSQQSIKSIFSTMLDYFFGQGFAPEIVALSEPIVDSSVAVFELAGEELLPTPAKSHYSFNLRDIWKVFQGICSLRSKKVTDPLIVVRCYCHENIRVFGDRLTNIEDRSWLKEKLDVGLRENFKLDPAEIFQHDRLIFGDFMGQGDTKFYVQIDDMQQMKTVMESLLEDYNNMFSIAMPLVMFTDACEHVARICRVIRQPSGNVLLLGVGGSGRQSLSRLASFMSEFDCFQITVIKGYGMKEFRDDVKTCLMKCGNDLKTQTFLFADTQIVNEQMVEAINNVLNSGDVPNLYAAEDMDAITMACRAGCTQAGMPPTKANIFSIYLARVKACVHVVLAFSPMGDAFRSRLRMFPSLVNCCTMDWFSEWPAEALYSVGKQQITLANTELPDLEGCLVLFRVMHQSVEASAKRVLTSMKRAIYITPTSFLELIDTFKKVLALRRGAVGTLRNRLQKGLDALGAAAYAVANMENELRAKQPALEATNKQVAEMMVVITEDKQKAAVTKQECEVVEAEAQTQAASATEIKEDAQRDLDEALPALNVAEKALKALKLASIQEIKSLANPPAGVRLTLEATCIMFQIKPIKKADPDNPGKKFDDYWEASQKGPLSDPKKLLEDLFQFDKDNIPENVISKIGPYIERTDFDPVAIKKASVACEALCMWCRAMHKYHFVARAVEPKRKMLADAEASLEITMKKLRAAQAELKGVEDKLMQLENDYNASVAKQSELAHEMEVCSLKLANATKLIDGLGGEKDRWQETVASLTSEYDLLVGDSLVAAGMVSYAGPFTGAYRAEFEDLWAKAQDDNAITHQDNVNLVSVLGQPVTIQEWTVNGLPNDGLSVENGIILANARRWPLMIDPQRQANKYIKTYGKSVSDGGLSVCKPSDAGLLQKVELGIQFGKWVLLENIGEQLDAALEPVLQQQKIRDGSSFVIKLGDKVVTYDLNFRFFLTTTLSNPHYSPEVSVKVTLLNFAITPEGLQDQMLGIVVLKEQPEMEEKKQLLTKNNASMNKQLKQIEDDILRLLSAEGDILESKELIETLEHSKKTSAVINKAMEEARVTEQEIDTVRKSYRDYAFRASILFFGISELSAIDPMYQFSLPWFQQLAGLGIDNASSGSTQEERLQNLIAYFTYSLYQSVCRGLFEKHKLLFSFALTMKIMQGEDRLDGADSRFLMTGPTGDVKNGLPNPAPEWISEKCWNEVLTVDLLPSMRGFAESFTKHVQEFQHLYDVPETEKETIPGGWEEKLTPMQKMCFLRTIRPDRLTTAVLNFVKAEMGQKFVEPPTFDIAVSYEDSTKMSPLIFVLVPGSDPVSEMLEFAESMNMTNNLESISLGQGQGPKATRLIDRARETGGWVLLCNCHLSISWLPELERICEQMNPEETHNSFRLWLTSMPTPQFPPLLLQNGMKMTNEPPKGLRANVLGSMAKFDDRMLADCNKPEAYGRLVFAFCFFHAVCQDRRKFGPIGWNIPYNFTPEDLATNRRQLKYFLDNYEEIPYKVLQFLGAQINYGGRVTDKKDKVLIDCMIQVFICEEIVMQGPDYKFSASGIFYCPDAADQDGYLQYLKGLPLMTPPEVFGLHANCEITCAESESFQLLEDVMAMGSSSGSSSAGGKSPEAVMDELAKELQDKTPKKFDLDALEEKFPTMYEESRNTVFKQEAAKYNKLLILLAAQLPLFRRAIKGLVAMTDDLEALGRGLFMNSVPETWANVGFLSLKPLTSWYKDLLDRVDFFMKWFEFSHPISFWVSGLFFPQAFFTAVMQNYARANKFAIDLINFEVKVRDDVDLLGTDVKEHPESGCYMYGFFLEGASWSVEKHSVAPSLPKQLFCQLPMIHFLPELNWTPKPGRYVCPCYKVLSRKGTLSTTGHSTNFVRDMELPSDDPPEIWIRGGVASFLALKY